MKSKDTAQVSAILYFALSFLCLLSSFRINESAKYLSLLVSGMFCIAGALILPGAKETEEK